MALGCLVFVEEVVVIELVAVRLFFRQELFNSFNDFAEQLWAALVFVSVLLAAATAWRMLFSYYSGMYISEHFAVRPHLGYTLMTIFHLQQTQSG